MAAVIALISPRRRIATIRTGALNIAIRQEAPICGTVRGLHRILEDVYLLMKGQEEILGEAVVVLGSRFRIQIPGDTEPLPYFAYLTVIICYKFAWCNTLLLCINENGCAMLIAAGDHQDMIACQTMISCKGVCREVCADDLPHMRRAFGIRPGNAH